MIGSPSPSGAAGILCYAAAAALALFELAAFALALHPQVSDAYRAYFITRTIDCWPKSAAPFPYAFGNRLLLTSEAQARAALPVLGCGWATPESWGTWTLGPKADLYLGVQPASTDMVLQAMVQPFVGRRAEQEVKVSIDGAPAATWIIPAGEAREMTAPIPQAVTRDGVMRITFEIAHPSSPKELGTSTDTRQLGMGLTWLLITSGL